MTTDEMQRFIDRESRRGASEYEALQALAEVIGIVYHPAAPKAGQGGETPEASG
ncbi:MAG: hypothetical protein IJT94_03755 [Oscillibacter sp.]|nr:hypothetical protein [Oscillibacter sp.]